MTKKISVNVKSAPRNAEEVMDMFISEVNSFTVSKRKVKTTEKSEPIFVVRSKLVHVDWELIALLFMLMLTTTGLEPTTT